MKAFLFGAGASSGTFNGSDTPVPVPARFGQVLQALDPAWKTSYPALASIVRHLGLCEEDWNLEDVWTCADYYAKFESTILEKPRWSCVGPEMKKALLQVYGKRCDCAAEQLAKAKTDDYALARVLKKVNPGDILISFNWDTIVERLAIHRFNLNLRAVDSKDRDRVITLAKPHGSTSWKMVECGRKVISASDCRGPRLDSLTAQDVDEKKVEPLLLGTVPIKSELIREVQKFPVNGQSWAEVFKTVSLQWKAVFEAIRDASTIVVVGYSFPKEDEYGRFLIREAMRRRREAKRAKPTVEFFELKHKACERAKAIMDVFEGNVEKPVYRGEVGGSRTGGQGCLPNSWGLAATGRRCLNLLRSVLRQSLSSIG